MEFLLAIYAYVDQDQEYFAILVLDVKNKGALPGRASEYQVLLRNALLLGANRIILCHNHPSGDPEPRRKSGHVEVSIEKEI